MKKNDTHMLEIAKEAWTDAYQMVLYMKLVHIICEYSNLGFMIDLKASIINEGRMTHEWWHMSWSHMKGLPKWNQEYWWWISWWSRAMVKIRHSSKARDIEEIDFSGCLILFQDMVWHEALSKSERSNGLAPEVPWPRWRREYLHWASWTIIKLRVMSCGESNLYWIIWWSDLCMNTVVLIIWSKTSNSTSSRRTCSQKS